MFTIDVLRHAVKMLFHDTWATLRLTLLPVAIGVGLGYLAALAIVGDAPSTDVGAVGRKTIDGRTAAAILVNLLMLFIGFAWGAVGWHRYGLLSERPGALLPRFDTQFFWAYVWAAIRLALMSVVLFLPLVLLIALLLSMLGADRLPLAVILIAIPAVLVSAMLLRYSLILPAAAIGQPITLREARLATQGRLGAFVALGILLTVIGNFAEREFGGGVLGFVTWATISWFSLALGLSVLTTLYGVFVEKRELS